METTEHLGFRTLCANDHLLFSRPWLDGPTALPALLSHTELALATTISLPVVRGRTRFDESIKTLRALWDRDRTFTGEFYSTEDITLEPSPVQEAGLPIWIGSWGSNAGLRRVGRLGDGWLAPGYNTTPEMFEDGKKRLCEELSEAGMDPDQFPNSIATMFFHVTEDEAEAIRIIHDRLAPTLGCSAAELTERLLIGSAQTCADKLAAYQMAGVQRVYLWPVEHELKQLRLFREQIVPEVNGPA